MTIGRREIDRRACAIGALAAVLIPVAGMYGVLWLGGDPEGETTPTFLSGFAVVLALFVLVIGIPLVAYLNVRGFLRPLPLILFGALLPAFLGFRAIRENFDRCVGLLNAGTLAPDCAAGGYVLLIAGPFSAASGYLVYRIFERRTAVVPA